MKCVYCRKKIPQGCKTVDHIMPRNYGGDDSKNNLAKWVCFTCNSEKHDYPFREIKQVVEWFIFKKKNFLSGKHAYDKWRKETNYDLPFYRGNNWGMPKRKLVLLRSAAVIRLLKELGVGKGKKYIVSVLDEAVERVLRSCAGKVENSACIISK